MVKTKKTTVFLFTTLLLTVTISNAQNQIKDRQELESIITYHDSMFWKGFNTCDFNIMKNYVSDDLEFYHDKNGLIQGAETFLKTSKKNLCGQKNNWRLRREAVKGSIKIYPINNYGAIISGDHTFYITENNNPEYLDGIAKFTHVWQLKDGLWKMTRVLSYDHKNPPQNLDKKEISLPNDLLDTFLGEYLAPNSGAVIVTKKTGLLQIKAGKMLVTVYPQSKSLFFSKEAPLTFEFVKDGTGNTIKMIVREQGKIVEEALKKQLSNH
ncbi:nuclear transport factor 2 family protein [Flavivirga sp. 57AJ16]|uniref:nuclear transport factor 2 family protein n=1 Tax=Flavivirga sp. 57AJ16 TaxID=3025307 RepID=UPI00236623A8|nr:nuclear transport factor 2 family protein [Flavivirga sp. 57AJ16]MDD7886706.1 nuclear transport factor 2 family protein [Flavivirga sp. 57AJ16]